jgi:hypothetical protein
LEKELKKDPFGFDITSYKYSIETMNNLRKNPQESEKNFKPDVETVQLKFSSQVEEGVEQLHQLDAKVFTGVINSRDYEKDIKKLTVSNSKLITVDYRNKDSLAKDWIPGARVVVQKEGEESPKFFLIIRRSKSFLVNTLKFEVEELELWDLFEDSDVSVQRFATRKNLRFGLFNFNFDSKTRQCLNRNLPVYKDNVFTLTCTECYSYVEAEVDLKFKVNWRRGITLFKNIINGNTKLFYDVLASSQHQFTKRIEKELFKTKGFTIRFSIGPVPIWIDFYFLLKLRGVVDTKHDTTLSFKGEFNSTLSIGFEYDADKPQGQRFNTIKGYKQSDIRDLIPKPQFRTNIELTTGLSLVPEVQVHFFSAAGLKLGLVPNIDATLKGDFGNRKTSCERNHIYYESAFDMKGYAQLLKLKIWKFEASLGGLLPYPKDPINEFNIIERKVLKKGCFKL